MSEIAVNAELNFHEQEVLSIFHETNVSGTDEQFAELAFAGAFAIRTMANLGPHEVSDALSHQLRLLGPLITESPNELLSARPQIVDYPGHKGRKRFISGLRLNPSQVRLSYYFKGFGFFATGVAYYAPAAVSSLFRYFASRRISDTPYLTALTNVAAACGQLQLNRQIQVSNQQQVLLTLILGYMDDYIPEWMR